MLKMQRKNTSHGRKTWWTWSRWRMVQK